MDENCKAVVLTDHILEHLSKIDSKQDKIFEELKEQSETLVRNTVSLEEHIRRTNLIEEHLYKQEEKVEIVEKKVDSLEAFKDKINLLFSILKPTKTKIKILVILAGLIGGGYKISELDFSQIFLQKVEQVIN